MKKTIRLLAGCLLTLLTASAHAAQPIQPFEADGMARILAGQKGKPFVLVVWSLDCGYCLASLTHLAREKRKHKSLKVVTLATDTLSDERNAAMMQKKLKAAGIASEAWAFGAAPPEQLRYAIDGKWHGELPRSYWFDGRGGKVAHSGVIAPEVIARLMPRS
ncbi:TlpA family protein disulfide reductase [Pseudoduganella namucuonensis]|uniref:Redoxin domain-containing protein n=1 Tax=Pseudoduganella namucuonensis TaxID=1035707 RepID=A0A1I7FKH0_9BURK|nr:hypothetical protein [Pseudoduganella namucuonensis]SFU36546.1 hypothetical protein SAMN05216552_100298 [Pseudoduganella namucuonensis]